ncbi:MAG: MBOAT family protein [Lachnospiraceae bacterium]|nr:MBOAT family protein [Lachnospiraceae bacterium]
MTLISATFILFLGLALLLYYLFPSGKRWYVLLAASLVFYLCSGWKRIVFVLFSCLTGYLVTRKIAGIYEKASRAREENSQDGQEGQQGRKKQSGAGADAAGKKEARAVLTAGLVVIIGLLFVTKTAQMWTAALASLSRGRISLAVIVPLGISYYTFALAGYMADVYWKKDQAETNFLKLLLYLIYFPHITQGPIPRHGRLAKQLFAGAPFDYRRLCFGLQRMVWGFFKKSVAADRLALVTAAVFSGEEVYPGSICLLAVICSALQLYFDFSGCMDIVIGVSECFGITLDENCTRPFFARSAAEFWRRWHITLGTWFKDYVYLPVSISGPVTRLSRRMKDRFGRKAARNVMTVIPLAIVWLLTGLWHGTGPDYILWGCYWGVIIIFSTVFAKEIREFDKKLHIDPAGRGWQVWQMIRTFLIYCGGRLLTAPGSLSATGRIIRQILTGFKAGALADGTWFTLGLDLPNTLIFTGAFILIAAADILNERGVLIREKVGEMPLVIRWLLYYLLIMTVVLFGKYGAAFDSSAFIYAGF